MPRHVGRERYPSSNLRAFSRSEFQYFAGLNELLSRFYRSIIELREPPIPYRDILWIARVSERVFQELERQEQGPALERGVA